MLLLWITDTSKDGLQRNAVKIRVMPSKTAGVGTVHRVRRGDAARLESIAHRTRPPRRTR